VESVILELRSKEHVLTRVRAGVIKHGSAEVLRQAGLGRRLDSERFVHDGSMSRSQAGCFGSIFEG
jgi:p-hydroxybenzoate 3-monooxygenase